MPQHHSRRREILASQSIDEGGPGSVLADFEALLGFVEQGVRSTGKHSLLPMARLFELDQRMTRPLRPRLKRPQQKSFPHLNGLYLLLRATQFGVPKAPGTAGGVLTLDAAMHQQWLELNPTERYFNLLEAWLRRGDWGMLGLPGRGWMNQLLWDAHRLWTSIPPAGRVVSPKDRRRGDFPYSTEQACTLALLELFGLMTVERAEPDEGQSWRVTEVRHTPFGDELLQAIIEHIPEYIVRHQEPAVAFGVWQPLLQPFFPQWVNNLEFPGPEFREGLFQFRVSLGKPWRRIAIPAGCDLDELAECIIRAFDFGGDHLYAFQFFGRDGRPVHVEHPYVDDAEIRTDEMAIGELPLTERQSMRFQYDFGANWQFNVRLEKIEPEDAKVSRATIVESHGEAPPEYEFEDEDEW